jgi:hypothetical protein
MLPLYAVSYHSVPIHQASVKCPYKKIDITWTIVSGPIVAQGSLFNQLTAWCGFTWKADSYTACQEMHLLFVCGTVKCITESMQARWGTLPWANWIQFLRQFTIHAASICHEDNSETVWTIKDVIPVEGLHTMWTWHDSLAICYTLVSFSTDFPPWRWRWYVPQKSRFTYGLHGAIFQKMEALRHIVCYLGTHIEYRWESQKERDH